MRSLPTEKSSAALYAPQLALSRLTSSAKREMDSSRTRIGKFSDLAEKAAAPALDWPCTLAATANLIRLCTNSPSYLTCPVHSLHISTHVRFSPALPLLTVWHADPHLAGAGGSMECKYQISHCCTALQNALIGKSIKPTSRSIPDVPYLCRQAKSLLRESVCYGMRSQLKFHPDVRLLEATTKTSSADGPSRC